MVVTRPGNEKGKEVIEGFGNPATFYQMQDNGKPVKGRASKMRYELQNDYVVLTGNAYLEQLDSNIKGDKITYLVKEQKNAGLQRQRSTRHHRSGAVRAAGQKRQPAKEE